MVRHKFGSRAFLKLEEIPKPVVGDDDVLVRVHAASVNAGDWELLRADPLGQFLIAQFFFRVVMGGLLKPQFKVLGGDVAGRVEAVGKNVKQFQPGDQVFGDTFGTGLGSFAEYVCVPESAALVPKPASLTFEEAAAVPQGAVIALQGLRKGEIESGQKVLINGAGGSVGTFAVQIAKSFGSEVTGVDSTPKLDMLRSIGADHVIDYTQEDFTQSGQRYDLILDVKGYRSVVDYKRALSSDGVCVWTGGSTPRMIEAMVLGGKRVSLLLAELNKKDLVFVTELLETGRIIPVIDKRYPLSDVAEALQYMGEGHALGKVIITV